jgi:hypothetical protein
MSWNSGRVIGDQDCKTHPRQPTNQPPTKAQLLFRFGRITSLVHRPLGSDKVSMCKIRDFVYCSDRRKNNRGRLFRCWADEGARKEAEALGCAVGNATQWTHDAPRTGTRAYVFVGKRERAGQKGWEGNAAGNFDEIG